MLCRSCEQIVHKAGFAGGYLDAAQDSIVEIIDVMEQSIKLSQKFIILSKEVLTCELLVKELDEFN